ncbi:putative retrotransposon protein, partial [Tanacetum coccineum]
MVYGGNPKDTFLVYGGNPEAELQVKCYCDAGFETDRDDTKSQTGYVFILNGGAVVWKSSKQSTTAQHATEAEYIAASEAAKEAVWIRKFIDELGVVPSNDYPIKMNCDNSAAIIIAKESGIQKGARHFQRKYHYVRECIKTGEIDIVKVHTDENLADPFTKALAGPKLTRHARSMGLRPASSFIMRRDDVRRVARNPVTWDELEVNGNERAYDTGRFIRYPSVCDGNCSFRSYSQAIAGHQGLHVVFRKGTEAWMRAHPHIYKPRNMRLDEYRRYLANQVGVVGTPVGMDVEQAAADLLQVRMIRTYAKYPQVIGEITPLGGRFFYEINLGNIPGHVDTLARSHLCPYHLQ